MSRRDRHHLGWLLAVIGAAFLVSGLMVMVWATVAPPHGPLGPQPEPSLWVTLADHIMNFVLALLRVDWTPARVGVFLVLVGLLLEGGAVYLLSGARRR